MKPGYKKTSIKQEISILKPDAKVTEASKFITYYKHKKLVNNQIGYRK